MTATEITGSQSIPQIGMLATVRNRLGIISSVEQFPGPNQDLLHLVSIEYCDLGSPRDDQLIWEREPGAKLTEPNALPNICTDEPMQMDEYDAFVRATRWTAISPYLDPDRSGPLEKFPISSPFYGAIKIDDYQLVPLLKAQRMPRVNLLLADDVGLGKTIEAGLILSELILRRRIRRILIICPASLRLQWKQEMHDKFSINFDIIDRDQTHQMRKELGLDSNPWRTYSKIITSYHYLKQADILEQFLATCRTYRKDDPHLPWDLLIVDEAHNLAPSSFGDDSDLSKMLGFLTPHFEHKLFLTATPHNGHTRSFTGLLERLDPVRFSQRSELKGAEKDRIPDVLIRRMKSEINRSVTPSPFCERFPVALSLTLSPQELALNAAFQEFRKKIHKLIGERSRSDRQAGYFAVEVLGKRLLSCPIAFADSWYRYLDGISQDETADSREVLAAERAVDEETGDDRENESRTAHAVKTVGAWLKPFVDNFQVESGNIEAALKSLGIQRTEASVTTIDPKDDARFNALIKLIEDKLRSEKRWVEDERLVVFTEYKTTLDYLYRRLTHRYGEDGSILQLFGGMDDYEREDIKAAFNNPAHPVRILLATDAASEGLNLQETARFLLHYDIPWNPARLEQRNGRLDRHGQARDVFVYHFDAADDADLNFLAYVVRKVHNIREDLGSTGEVFEAGFERRFIHNVDAGQVKDDIDQQVELVKGRADVPRESSTKTSELEDQAGKLAREQIDALAKELDLDPGTLRDTLEIALGMGVGCPRFDEPDSRGRLKLTHPIPPDWITLIDDTLRLKSRRDDKGFLPGIVFDPHYFIRDNNGRPIFRPEKDTVLLHLGHPLFHRALSTYARARFPGEPGKTHATRWIVRRGQVPKGADALILLTVEELGVNRLRESFHHWVKTYQLPVTNGTLGKALPHKPASELRLEVHSATTEEDIKRARDIWLEVEGDVKTFIKTAAEQLTKQLREVMVEDRAKEEDIEAKRFASRRGELSILIEQQTLKSLERELALLQLEKNQGVLFDRQDRLEQLERDIQEKEEELRRRQQHYSDLREQLDRESERILKKVLPNRFALHGPAQVFPVAVEIRLPGGAS